MSTSFGEGYQKDSGSCDDATAVPSDWSKAENPAKDETVWPQQGVNRTSSTDGWVGVRAIPYFTTADV